MSNLVPNPMYEDLSDLYSQLESDAATLSSPLKSAAQTMAGGTGDCWTGPQAQTWAGQLSGHSEDCARQVRNMLNDISAAMASIPQKVTAQEAQGIAKGMALESEGF